MLRDGRITSKDLSPVFRGSFVAGEFKSDAFTNVTGLSFPTKFEMREYRPLPNASNTNDFRCTLIVKGEVRSISTTRQIWSNELPKEALAVNDYRFYTNCPVSSYLVSNGSIPPLNDPELAVPKQEARQRLRAIEKAAIEARSRDIHAKSYLVRILLGATTFAPILLLLRRIKINKQMKG